MASDPFHTFASTVRSSLTAARDLSAQYTSLIASASSTSTSSSLRRPPPSSEDDVLLAHDRLNDALEALKQDVDDVRQSVAVVRRSPERFAVDEAELGRREEFLRMCQEEVKVRLAGCPTAIERMYAPERGRLSRECANSPTLTSLFPDSALSESL